MKATALQTLHDRATSAGIASTIINQPKAGVRKHSALGSTYSASKVIVLNGIRMSIGQAKQYIAAREA